MATTGLIKRLKKKSTFTLNDCLFGVVINDAKSTLSSWLDPLGRNLSFKSSRSISSQAVFKSIFETNLGL